MIEHNYNIKTKTAVHEYTHETKTSYEKLNDEFMDLWNQWYAAATESKSSGTEYATKLLEFLQGDSGKELIAQTLQRIKEHDIHVPRLLSFEHQVHSSIRSLKIYINNQDMVPQAASQYLASMQSYMSLCRTINS